jgi:hypothetical protein
MIDQIILLGESLQRKLVRFHRWMTDSCEECGEPLNQYSTDPRKDSCLNPKCDMYYKNEK